jgi:hypothetical protein
MKASAPIIALCVAACSAASNVALESITARLSPGGEVTLAGARTVRVQLDPEAPDIVYFEIASIDGDDTGDLLRWHSPALYARLGQTSPGYLIYSRNLRRADVDSDDFNNTYAARYPVIQPETEADRTLSAIHARMQATNSAAGRTTCTGNTGADLLTSVEAGECFVACSGASIIAADYAPSQSRVLLLWPRIDELGDNVRFMRSEGHTTSEIMGADGAWQVFDATYGFAWVAQDGRRLDTQGLIASLAAGQAGDLTFAVLVRGELHAVPGDRMLAHQPMLAGMYYTADKRIEVTPYGRAAPAPS